VGIQPIGPGNAVRIEKEEDGSPGRPGGGVPGYSRVTVSGKRKYAGSGLFGFFHRRVSGTVIRDQDLHGKTGLRQHGPDRCADPVSFIASGNDDRDEIGGRTRVHE
jgi:hypothetical protein